MASRKYALSSEAERAQLKLARKSMWGFVRYVWPYFQWRWHHKIMCDACDRLLFGDSRTVMIFAPPRHGKSQIVSVAFPAFAMAHNPHWEVRFSTNTGPNAWKQSRKTQALMRDARFKKVFPHVELPSGRKRDGTAPPANRDEFALLGTDADGEKYRGSYACSGIGKVIVGTGWDLGILDDPIEGEAHASSPARKEALWSWFKGDFLSRKGPEPRLLVMHQRWCPDDLAGRLEEWGNDPDAIQCDEVISLPAEMTADYPRRHPEDKRKPGQALWPDRFPKKFLRAFKADPKRWRSMYQQLPLDEDAQFFDENCWREAKEMPIEDIVAVIRFWDLSGTETGDPWSGTLMAKDLYGVYYILHCAHFHAGSNEGDRKIRKWADTDAKCFGNVPQYFEQAKSDAGMHVINHYANYILPEYTVVGVPAKGSKEERATPYGKSQSAGNVVIVTGHPIYGDSWIYAFKKEHTHFPMATHDDRVDSSSGAWAVLAKIQQVTGKVVRSKVRPRRRAV